MAAQQDVDAAGAAVTAAQQDVDQATVTTPIAGTVVAVNMKVGDQVSAASSTENIVVQGSGGYQVTTTVNVDDIPHVAIGQDATVVPDGTHDQLTAKVVAISVAPASTTTTTTLYRVTVGLTDPTAKLQNGATGTVSIVTKQAHAAIAVPTSAVTTAGSRHFVHRGVGRDHDLDPGAGRRARERVDADHQRAERRSGGRARGPRRSRCPGRPPRPATARRRPHRSVGSAAWVAPVAVSGRVRWRRWFGGGGRGG